MIRIRTGASWKHDPRLAGVLRRAKAPERASAVRAVVDALAIEVDGVDITAGRAEGPLLPSLEALLRAVARVVGGWPHATVTFRDGDLELVLRRRGASAFLTMVELGHTSRVLAQDVEVEVDALAAAALEASAAFCRDLAAALPESGPREARRLRAAARDLRRAEGGPAPGPPRPRFAPGEAELAPGPVALALELHDEDGLLLAYEGGRADLGSLLVPGRLVLRAGGAELAAFDGIPFLALRDLGRSVDAIASAVRHGTPRVSIAIGRPGRGAAPALELDVAAGTVTTAGGTFPCPPLALARALVEGAARFGREARRRNARQAENGHVAELEAAAAERLAQLDELALADLASPGEPTARALATSTLPQRPLGPGRLRRLAFRRTFQLELGAPAARALHAAGGHLLAAGSAAIVAVERTTGRVAWRSEGSPFAAALPGALLLTRGGALEALSPRSGRVLWRTALPGDAPVTAFALAHGPLILVERAALTAIDPGSGRTLWRHEPPGSPRLAAAPFGGIAVVGSDSGLLVGLDVAGRTAWRLRAPGPVLRPPVAASGACVALCGADPGAVVLALDPARGERSWEARLDFAPAGPPIAWGRRLAVAGTVGGDPIIGALERGGVVAWSVSPPLTGAPAIAAAGPLLVARDHAGAVVALGRDGRPRWSRPAAPGAPPPGALSPAVARGTVLVAGDGIAALDAVTGELLAAIPGIAPVGMIVDGELGVTAVDADGLAAGWHVRTHLSVV